MQTVWATERKLVYGLIAVLILVILAAVPSFYIFYKPSSCFDNAQNQGETGVDCGGPCVNLCQAAQRPPVINWAQKFQVKPGVWSVAAYIENPNVTSEAKNVPYAFKLYNASGGIIGQRTGITYIPPHKKFAIFEGDIETGSTSPARISFDFTSEPFWQKSTTPQNELKVMSQLLTGEEVKPRIDAVVGNTSINQLTNIGVTALVYESNGNAIAASKTLIDSLPKGQSKQVTFTWPGPWALRVASCSVPADVMLVLDRSGSMASDGNNPPQPLTDVKSAAANFIASLEGNDKVGVVSFATAASSPIDQPLSTDFQKVTATVGGITIHTDGGQNTNIADGLSAAASELAGPNHSSGARSVIVLLTDGVATDPTNANDAKYPETYAAGIASALRDKGIEIYTIGLGFNVNADFLTQIGSGAGHYFPAATSAVLKAIYKQIATSLCKQGPTTIEIIPIVTPE